MLGFATAFRRCSLGQQQEEKPPVNKTLTKYINIATNFKEAALDVFLDLSYLNGRDDKHPDRTLFDRNRVTLKMIGRPEFLAMNGQEQEVYIYCLAKYGWLCVPLTLLHSCCVQTFYPAW